MTDVTIGLRWVVLLGVLALVALAFGAAMIGLWLGERGRRIAAERWLTTGSPEGITEATSTAPAKEAEDRLLEANQEVSRETVERMTADMLAEAKAKGLRVDPKQLKKDVESMLRGESVDG